jgi:hypothetical protein
MAASSVRVGRSVWHQVLRSGLARLRGVDSPGRAIGRGLRRSLDRNPGFLARTSKSLVRLQVRADHESSEAPVFSLPSPPEMSSRLEDNRHDHAWLIRLEVSVLLGASVKSFPWGYDDSKFEIPQTKTRDRIRPPPAALGGARNASRSSNESERSSSDFVIATHVHRHQGQQQRIRSGGTADTNPGTNQLLDLLFGRRNLRRE